MDMPTTLDVGRAFRPDPEAEEGESEGLRREAHSFLGGAGAGAGDEEAAAAAGAEAEVAEAVPLAAASVGFSSLFSSSALTGNVPLPPPATATADRETDVVDDTGEPGTVDDDERLSTTEVAEEGTVDESVGTAAGICGVSCLFSFFSWSWICFCSPASLSPIGNVT